MLGHAFESVGQAQLLPGGLGFALGHGDAFDRPHRLRLGHERRVAGSNSQNKRSAEGRQKNAAVGEVLALSNHRGSFAASQ